MNRFCVLLFFILSYFSLSSHDISHIPVDSHEGLLAVVIMVKDEAEVIVPTLQPFVDAGVDFILLYDTGSRDGTQHVARSYFESKNVQHAYILEDPFIDFATSRNRALDTAEILFPHVTFFVMLDAEWYIHNPEDLITFCEQHKNYIAPGTDGGCYSIRLITVQDNIDNYATRLFRHGKNVRYSGVVHESVKQIPSGCVPKAVYFEYSPKEFGREKSKKRCIRDYNLLKDSLEDDPYNPRTLFYLAQTCQFMNEWREAIVYYKKRADIGDISEECYLALYRIGCAIEYLYVHDNEDGFYRWEDAMHYYLKAHAMLPHRAEPLVRIANYYNYIKDYAVAYLFAQRAVDLPYPHNDKLFVEKNTYEYLRYDILGQCALYVGEYQAGKSAVLNAMKVFPSAQHLQHNLGIYLQCIS